MLRRTIIFSIETEVCSDNVGDLPSPNVATLRVATLDGLVCSQVGRRISAPGAARFGPAVAGRQAATPKAEGHQCRIHPIRQINAAEAAM